MSELKPRMKTYPYNQEERLKIWADIFEGKAVWHLEHCGRIIWLSHVLSEKINNHFLQRSELKEKPL